MSCHWILYPLVVNNSKEANLLMISNISLKYVVEQFYKSHHPANYKSITKMREEYPVLPVHEITAETKGYKWRSQWLKNKLRSIK